MKQFLAVYLGSSASPRRAEWDALDESSRRRRERDGIEAWMAWGARYRGAIVTDGSPLGRTKLVDARGVTDTKNLLTAYTVVRAESHAAAAEMFVNHPHFTFFPGESVEIMECLPLPAR